MLVHEKLKGNRSANRIAVIDGITYMMRVWLGVIAGINICLDFATNNRDAKYTREVLLQEA